MFPKRLLIIAGLLSLATAAFAQVSIGLEGSVSLYSVTTNFSGSYSGSPGSATGTFSQTPFGVGVFLDATYLQLSAAYQLRNGGNNTYTDSGSLAGVWNYYGFSDSTYNYKLSYVDFAAYLKFPVKFASVTLFPLLGAEYDLNLSFTDSSGNNMKPLLSSQQQADLNQIWLKAGGGFDFDFGSVYFRPEVLLGLKLLSKTDQDTINQNSNFLSTNGYTGNSSTMSYLTFDFAAMVGFKL